MKKKPLAVLAVAVLGLGVGGSAGADPLTEATVEGSASVEPVFIPNTADAEYVWSCRALASAPVSSTGVTCTLYVGGVLIDTASMATPGMASATADVTRARFNVYEVCWEALVHRLDNTTATDTGCVSGLI